MPGLDILLPFLVATAAFAYVPGPAMLYAAAQTLSRGRRAGLMAALGIHLGGYVHIAAAALGLAALFEAVPVAYAVVKFCGAAYLVFLGVRMWRGRDDVHPSGAPATRAPWRAFGESVAVEVLNPKTALFMLAFLPQFTDPAAGWPVSVQLAVLGFVVNLVFTSADLVVVLSAGAFSRGVARSARARKIARGVAGTTLIGLGANLALKRAS